MTRTFTHHQTTGRALLTALCLLLAPVTTSAQSDTAPASPVDTVTQILTPQLGTNGQTNYTPVQTVQHGQTVIVQTTLQTNQGSLRNISIDVPVLPQSGFLGIESVTPGVTLTYSLDGVNYETVPFVTTSRGRLPARPREYRAIRMNIPELLPGQGVILRMIVNIN